MPPRAKRAFFAALSATATMAARRPPGLRGLPARALAATRATLWSFLASALTPDEKSRLGVALYDATTSYRDAPSYPWEDAWLARWLPRPSAGPSRILMGAAGAGREVEALLARGHEVVALEPSADLAALCRERTAGRVVVIELRYEELDVSDVFDAVLLGLGSLSHVLAPEQRFRLARTLARLCPTGPILASVLSKPRGRDDSAARAQQPLGKAERLGRALARPIRAARQLGPLDPGEVLFGGLGFARLFTRGELIAFGRAMGRRTHFDDAAPDGMELCAFVPE